MPMIVSGTNYLGVASRSFLRFRKSSLNQITSSLAWISKRVSAARTGLNGLPRVLKT